MGPMSVWICIVLLACGLRSVAAGRQPSDMNQEPGPTCGYQTCNPGKSSMTNVHLISHSHMDPGYRKTVDEYYYGSKSWLQFAGVQYVFDTVVDELSKDPAKRFILVEMSFFSRWWRQQTQYKKDLVRLLVNEGRLEFALGGWTSNDEAVTHYTDIIDQHTLGFRFIKDNFGDCGLPKVAWQVDAFGHSKEQASLFAQFGFDGMFFARLDPGDMEPRREAKEMEMLWRGSEILGDQSSLFTHVLHDHYGPPYIIIPIEPVMDDHRLENYNVDWRVELMRIATEYQAQHYGTNHIMMLMGQDFTHQNAHMIYKELDKLIFYVNQKQTSDGLRVHAFHSTPACYLYAVNKAQMNYTQKTDDFLPLGSNENTYWTGYYTSRPALKLQARLANGMLQACKQLATLAKMDEQTDAQIDVLRQAVGLLTHHDGITGTCRQHVANDYYKRLSRGIHSCQGVVNDAYAALLSQGAGFPEQVFCDSLNVSYCPITENSDEVAVLLYNPLARSRDVWVRIPVTSTDYSVSGPDLLAVPSQVVPLSTVTTALPSREASNATAELVFLAALPPLGFMTYFIHRSPDVNLNKISLQDERKEVSVLAGDFTLENEFLNLTFDGASGLLRSLTNKEESVTVQLHQQLMYYYSYRSLADPEATTSSVYIFRPNSTQPLSIAPTVSVTTHQGELVSEVRQVFSDHASQVYRLYKDQKHVELEWTLGPLPFTDDNPVEFITHFSTDLDNNDIYYTDGNGREMIRRVRNHRETWNITDVEPIAANYYPITASAHIEDLSKGVRFSVLTDRSQGGGSMRNGDLEIMLHRRGMSGVEGLLDERDHDGQGLRVRGKHYLMLRSLAAAPEADIRSAEKEVFAAPVASFAALNGTMQEYKQQYFTSLVASRQLEPPLHLLTLEPWQGSARYLLRLEHYIPGAPTASVSLQDLLLPLEIKGLQETTLGANQPLSDATRLQWNVRGQGQTAADMSSFVKPVSLEALVVELKPMQVRSFLVDTVDLPPPTTPPASSPTATAAVAGAQRQQHGSSLLWAAVLLTLLGCLATRDGQ